VKQIKTSLSQAAAAPFLVSRKMKKFLVLITSILSLSVCYAQENCQNAGDGSEAQVQCTDTAVAGSSSLPKEAQEQVDELTVKMRYFKAIGFHDKSGEARDKIVGIYEQYGVPLPDEYKDE
jgi:hypothetical protein